MIPEYAEIKRCSKCGLVPTFTVYVLTVEKS